MAAETMTEHPIFGEAIHRYTRAQALEDGVLIDFSWTAREAGITYPVAMTATVYADCVSWSDEDNRRKNIANDIQGRLWDVIWMLRCAILRRKASGGSTDIITYELLRVPREGKGRRPRFVTLKSICGPGDWGEPVITIMQPDED